MRFEPSAPRCLHVGDQAGRVAKAVGFQKIPGMLESLRDETRRFDLVHRAFADRFFVTDD
jgi:hypothetical protein